VKQEHERQQYLYNPQGDIYSETFLKYRAAQQLLISVHITVMHTVSLLNKLAKKLALDQHVLKYLIEQPA